MKVLVFDTETTGIPDWKTPSEGPDQPHMVEVAGLLFDVALADGPKLVDSFSAIVRPDGWTIPADMTAIHGITQEQALAEGIPEAEALARLLMLQDRANLRVAHNKTFDERIVRIAIKRFGEGPQFIRDEIADAFKARPSFCTCVEGRRAMSAQIGFKKAPTLGEAHRHFTGDELVEAHRARPDAMACARIYFAIHGIKVLF